MSKILEPNHLFPANRVELHHGEVHDVLDELDKICNDRKPWTFEPMVTRGLSYMKQLNLGYVIWLRGSEIGLDSMLFKEEYGESLESISYALEDPLCFDKLNKSIVQINIGKGLNHV